MRAQTARSVDARRQSDRRLRALEHLARALSEARLDGERIRDALATSLTATLCDGCAVTPAGSTMVAVARHGTEHCDELSAASASIEEPVVHAFDGSEDARLELPAAYGAYIERFGLSGVAVLPLVSARGRVVVTRDRGSHPFNAEDLGAIETCIEYAGLVLGHSDERERTAQFQQEMLGIVGHDLRSPLSAILISTEILTARRADDPSAANAVTRIVSFANRMARMVDQLLDLTRTRLGGGIPLARSPMRLVPIIRSVVEDIALAHPAYSFELTAEADIRGTWDSDRVAQAVFNLLTNAVQYGREGAAIHVGVCRSEGGATISVHNEVRDTPIAPEALGGLFAPYRRGWDREHIGTGLGLGLYITHEIARAHGGTLTVESVPSGTTFRVALPDPALAA